MFARARHIESRPWCEARTFVAAPSPRGMGQDFIYGRRGMIGLMNFMPSPPVDAPQREQRTSKLIVLALSTSREKHARIVVRNVSPHGLGARGEIDLLPCERVTVHLPGGRDVAATVRWARNGKFGLALDERVDPPSLQTRAAASPTDLRSRDESMEFVPMKIRPVEGGRTGFKRSHRDQVLASAQDKGGSISEWIERG